MTTEPKKMTPEESLTILAQVAAKFAASGTEHAIIRDALLVYQNLINAQNQSDK